jgi:hypothetical protein
MAFDIKTALASMAPTLATMLGGPLAGTAVSALCGAFGMALDAGADDVTKAVQTGLTPESIAAVRAADQRHQEALAQQGIDLHKLNADHEAALAQLEVADRTSARAINSGRDAVWCIAAAILGTFALIMAAVLWGCFALITGGMPVKDASVVAAVSGLVGAVVGYVAANAQTVVNFIFGGSLGSEKKTDALAASVSQAIGSATRR